MNRRQHGPSPSHPGTNRAGRAGLLALIALGALACAPSSAVGPEGERERWQYTGEQRVPVSLQLEGTLTITRIDGERFEGALDLRSTDALGQSLRQAGLVVGRRSGGSVDFEAALAGDVLRHVGRIAGDTVRGTWLDDGALGGALRSGPFVLVRVP